jgi:uncharacterized protein (TIGR02231 family)
VSGTSTAGQGTVTRVRVFIDRAAITRKRILESPAAEVAFSPIPIDADTRTIRAEAELENGDGAVLAIPVRGVSWSVIYGEKASARQAEVRREQEAIRSELEALDDAEASERQSAELLHGYAQIATEMLSREWLDKEPSFDKWNAIFDQLRGRRSEEAMVRALRQRQRIRLKERQAVLLEEDYRLGRPEKLGYQVAIALQPPAAAKGRLSVELTYVTPRALWLPIYDARHLSGGAEPREKVVLTGIALVRQSTGEDWNGIELVATTARPPLSEPPPELALLVVSRHQSRSAREVVSTTQEVPRLTGALSRAPYEDAERSVEHVAPGRVTIASTNRPVRVELFSGELPCRSRLEVAPMERPVPILVAEIENRTGRSLLPGKVNLFRGPNYSGQTQIGFVTPNERFRLPLGTDASLRIKRQVKVHPEKKAPISGAATHAFEVRTVLENASNAPIEVLVRDRIPVSRTEDASIKVTEMDRAMEVHPESGLTTLPLTIAPHSKREIATSYRITAPRGFRLTPPPDL